MPRARTLLVVIAGLLAGTVHAAPATAALPTGFAEAPVITGLDQPSNVRFAPGGKVFVAEKRGVVRAFDSLNDTTPTTVADLRTETHNFWDRGMLGLAVDPGWPGRPYIYVLYTRDANIGGPSPKYGTAGADSDPCADPTGAGCIVSGRLARIQVNPATSQGVGAPLTLLDGWCQQDPSHSVGDLRFGPDGALYVSGGDGASFNFADYGQDRGNPCSDPPNEGGALRSQDRQTPGDPQGWGGTVLRADPNVPGSASIVGDGLRNPFRMTFRPGTPELWLGDVGWGTWEEVNRLDVGGSIENFGWPCYEGAARQNAYDSLNLGICEGLYSAGDPVVGPHFAYRHNQAFDGCTAGSSAIAGLAFYPGGDYPDEYDGGLFFADNSRACIWFMPRDASGRPDATRARRFQSQSASPVALETGPGGDLFYVDIAGGRLMRVTYQQPVAVADASPRFGPAPLRVQFDGSASTGVGLTYAWDLDGDGQFDDSTAVSPTRDYPAGNTTVRLRVTGAAGATSTSAPITISSGNTRPTASITAPSGSGRWSVGDLVSFAGTGTDAQDGDVSPLRMSWSLTLNHCPSDCHQHPVQSWIGPSGEFNAPDHEYPSHLTLSLTVTDSGGLTDTATVRLDPATVVLTLASEPAGLAVTLNAETGAAPLARTVIRGSSNLVAADASQGGPAFVSWSDGGAQVHNVTVLQDTTLVARFATGPPPSSPPPPSSGPGSSPGVGVLGDRVRRVTRRHPLFARADGTLRLRVRCSATSTCTARVGLRRAGRRAYFVTRAFKVPARSTRTVTVKLGPRTRALLARHGRLRVVWVTDLRSTGGAPSRLEQVFWLRPAARG